MEKIKIKAPAKINVGLNIVGKREDGFHNLETIFYQIQDLYDELIFEKSDNFELVVDGVPELEQDNIISKAVRLLEIEYNKKINIKITLIKNIPIGAGLGGGSSDGASTLLALNKLFNLNLSQKKLTELALQLGSDVPLFLHDYPTIGKSRGEILERINLKIPYPILLVNPGIHISTKDAFLKVIPQINQFDYSSISQYKIIEWNEKVINDFEKSIFELYHEIKRIKRTMIENGALFSLMSGTGSTVYGIFETELQAKFVAEKFPQSYFTFVGNR